MSHHHDIAVIGSGPAGTALVSALCDAGFDVAWCSSTVNDSWPNNFGLWVDEMPSSHRDRVFEAVWERPFVQTNGGPRTIDRAYGRVDGDALQAALLNGRELTKYAADVAEVNGEPGAFEVLVGDTVVLCGLVFDATGVGKFLEEHRRSSVAAQTAYGVLARVEGDPTGGHAMSLMDFDDSFRDDDGPATFLYAMQLGDLWFLEETVLVGRPPYPIGDLERLLHQRLESRGARVVEVLEEERCFIPMGTALPSFDQDVVGFGAAAGFVHPASGYSLARSLSAAGDAAEAAHTGDPFQIWRALWPEDRVQARYLYAFGMESLLGMDRGSTSSFFDAFFELPETAWRPYLAGTQSPGEVQRVMLKLFARAPMSIRLQLAKAALGPNTPQLLRGIFG